MDITNLKPQLDLSRSNWENLSGLVEAYEDLRARVYSASQANSGALMGTDAWLRNAVREDELNLYVGPDGIRVSGSTFTTQTQSHEFFDFTLRFSDLA